MTKARDIANSTETLDVDGGTIKLDGNYPVGTGNVALGDAALGSNVSGASNTAIGADALTSNTASSNTAVGYQAGYNNTTGRLTAVGFEAAQGNTTGTTTTAVGYQAAKTSSTADWITAVGHQALMNTTVGPNTAFGRALVSNTTGVDNFAAGMNALYYNTTGSENTAAGTNSLFVNTTGTNNTAFGNDAGYNVTGSYNTLLGHNSGSALTGSLGNTILGNFTGNQHAIDIRSENYSVVLADGGGVPLFFVKGNQYAGTLIRGSGNSTWGKFWKKITKGSVNNPVNVARVYSYSGNNRVYFRVRVMAVSATGNVSQTGVAYARINANGLVDQVVSGTTYEDGGSLGWSLSWSGGYLRVTPTFGSFYVGMVCDVEYSQHDGNAFVEPLLDYQVA